jgi:hypothetical protein
MNVKHENEMAAQYLEVAVETGVRENVHAILRDVANQAAAPPLDLDALARVLTHIQTDLNRCFAFMNARMAEKKASG